MYRVAAVLPSPNLTPLPRTLPRKSLLLAILLLSLPALFDSSSRDAEADAGALPIQPRMKAPQSRTEGWPGLSRRADSRTDACLRFSHQSVRVDDTIYIYGGQARTSSGQNSDTWNNNFITLSLSEDWDIASPKLKGLPQPNGPPAVANGYLWHNFDNIYLYGGLFSDTPAKSPTAFSLWQYNLDSGKWSDITSETSVSDDSGSRSIERAAEGAGVSIPERGLGFYFGGHLDAYTTEGWSIQTARVYLKSLLEFDMGSKTFTNITKNGLEEAGVPERADGTLSFVPWGTEGILVGIGGGRNDTFSQLNIVDIYDLSTRTWTKQATGGPTPQYRVNPCAVVGSASDGSSHNIYFFGGQNLVPYGSQVQFDDMWILTIPSFSWIEVDTSKQSVPPARAGHTCELTGREMVVIGGYVGQELSCDSPGVYIFDASSTEWKTSFSSNSELYKVPQVVINEIGGDETGGATITAPVRTADPDSPIATGKPGDYRYTTITSHTAVSTATITNADGTVSTTTSYASPDSSGSGSGSGSGMSVGVVVGAAIGGLVVLVLIAMGGAYLWYRKKIKELREASEKVAVAGGGGAGTGSGRTSGENGGRLGDSDSEVALVGEPTFWGVLLSPRRSLRVVNH